MIGNKLKELIKNKKENQYTASEKLGVSQGCLNLWINNKRNPSLEDIKNICEKFNTTPNYLFGFDEDITDQDRAILKAVKSVAGIQKQAESNHDTPKQVPLSEKERQ